MCVWFNAIIIVLSYIYIYIYIYIFKDNWEIKHFTDHFSGEI